MECCTTIQKCNGESELSRLSYIERICQGFSNGREFELPNADEAQSFDEAVAHVVSLCPNKGGLKACSSKGNTKEQLKEILKKLQLMERKRLYDPPADDEIGSYLLIKKYVRAIFTFFAMRTGLDQMFENSYDCHSYFYTLHPAQELIELNRYFADFSSFVLELDIEDGSMIKPLMGIGDNYEVPPLIHGSKERSNQFYLHKFDLARLDLRSLETVIFPPSAQEKRSYLQVLGHISSHPSAQTKDEVSVYTEELYRQFLEKVERELSDMVRHCTSVRNSLLDKMSMPSWECLSEMYNQDPDRESVELRRELVEKCGVPNERLNEYITCAERCRDIALIMSFIIDTRAGFDELDIPTCTPQISSMYGWEALHVLTLLKHGSFSPGNVFREYMILLNSKSENAKMKLECREARKRCADGSVKENENAKMKLERKVAKMGLKRCGVKENENVGILRGIVEDLRRMGDSDILPDKEEYILMHKIWYSVASSVHFFFSAMAYEQRRYVTRHGGSLNFRNIGVRRTKWTKKGCNDVKELFSFACQVSVNLWDLAHDMEHLAGIFHAYARGLRDKNLESQTQQ